MRASYAARCFAASQLSPEREFMVGYAVVSSATVVERKFAARAPHDDRFQFQLLVKGPRVKLLGGGPEYRCLGRSGLGNVVPDVLREFAGERIRLGFTDDFRGEGIRKILIQEIQCTMCCRFALLELWFPDH